MSMSRNYLFLTLIALVGVFVLLLLPEREKKTELRPEILLQEINNPSRYLSVDLVAERLISGDPSVFLIDVRNVEQYNDFALPQSVNIPLDSILSPGWKDYFNQQGKDIILYSNSNIFADQAWNLLTRLGYQNLYIMEGGLNKWFTQIMQPVTPPSSVPSEDFDRYTFRKAASMYFGGTQIPADPDIAKEQITIKKREKKSRTAGGC
jgi:rhodanese-related sulfurtransferase